MAVPKKRTSLSKKRIRKSVWKKKSLFCCAKSFCFSKIRLHRTFKKFFCTTN